MSLFSFFSRKIKVSQKALDSNICVIYNKWKSRKIKLNTELFLPEQTQAVFSLGKEVCEVFKNPEKYVLNGNSLPNLFRKGDFNKPNSKNYISPYFRCNIWFIKKHTNEMQIVMKKYRFKDEEYGRQRVDFFYDVRFDVEDGPLFVKKLLQSGLGIGTKNTQKAIYGWIYKDLKKWLSKRNFTLKDLVKFTKMYNDNLSKNFEEKYKSYGISITYLRIQDVALDLEIERQIINSANVASDIQKRLKKFDFEVYSDGVPMQKQFEMGRNYTAGSLQDKFKNKQNGLEVVKDESEYTIKVLASSNKEEEGTTKSGKYCLCCGKFIPLDAYFCPYCSMDC